jgi:hypothetical protein
LEAKARRRAVEGMETPILYQGKMCYTDEIDPKTGEVRKSERPLSTRRYSDALLMFLPKGARPEKYRDNGKGPISRPRDAAQRIEVRAGSERIR